MSHITSLELPTSHLIGSGTCTDVKTLPTRKPEETWLKWRCRGFQKLSSCNHGAAGDFTMFTLHHPYWYIPTVEDTTVHCLSTGKCLLLTSERLVWRVVASWPHKIKLAIKRQGSLHKSRKAGNNLYKLYHLFYKRYNLYNLSIIIIKGINIDQFH